MVKGADSRGNINPAARDSSCAILINTRSIVPRLRGARVSKTKDAIRGIRRKHRVFQRNFDEINR
jgi:hypothetical protein